MQTQTSGSLRMQRNRWRRWIPLAGLLLVASSGWAQAPKEESADAHLVRGIDCFRERRYDEALIEFRIASEIRPDDGTLLHYIGAAYYEQGAYEDALMAFQRGLILAPGFGDEFSFYYMARACYRCRLYAAARDGFLKILELSPGSKFAQESRQFIAEIDGLLAKSPDRRTIDWYYDRGLQEIQKQRHLYAESYFREILALQERHPELKGWRGGETAYYLAYLLNRRDAYAEALGLLETVDVDALRASASAISIGDVLYQRGFALGHLERLDEARAALAQALAENPLHAFAHYHMGRIECAARNYETAIAHLTEARKLDASLGDGCAFFLGRCHFERGEFEAARGELEGVARRHSGEEVGRQAKEYLEKMAAKTGTENAPPPPR